MLDEAEIKEEVSPLGATAPTESPVHYPAETNQGWVNAKRDRWSLLSDAYSGDGGFQTGFYLVPHRREEAGSFKLRKMKARYANDFKTIINALVTPIFRKDAHREFSSNAETMESWMETASRNGASYQTNMKTLSRNARKYDTSYCLVSAPEEGVTLQSEMGDIAKMPYLSHITPPSVVSQVMTEAGVLLEFSWKTTEFVDGKMVDAVMTYTTTQWMVINEKTKKVLRKGDNALGYVPVFVLYGESNDNPSVNPMPRATANSLASIALRRYGLASIIDEISDGSAYPLLAITGDGGVGDLDLGVNNAIVLPEVGSSADYIQPDYAVLTTLYSTMYAGMTNEMYSSANVVHQSKVAQSAESRVMEADRTQENLADFAQTVQDIDARIMNTVLDYLGLKTVDYTVTYPTDFGLRAMDQDLVAYNALKEDTSITPEVKKLIAMRIAKQLLSGIPESELKLAFGDSK